LLRSTKIGVIVNRLKAHKDPAVAKQAGEVVSKWRMDVKKAGASGASTPRPVANGTSSPAPSPVPAIKAKSKLLVPPEKRNSREDKVNTALTGNQVRDSCLKLMYDGLAFMTEVCK
jgi:transcription elongation factor S-II